MSYEASRGIWLFFNSTKYRLLNLREDKGYTYGVYSFFNGDKDIGAFVVFSSIKTEATDSALVEILTEIENYTTDGITDDELRSTKSSMLNSNALKYESPMQKLSFLNKILEYDLDKTYIKKQSNIINSITKESDLILSKAAKQYQILLKTINKEASLGCSSSSFFLFSLFFEACSITRNRSFSSSVIFSMKLSSVFRSREI